MFQYDHCQKEHQQQSHCIKHTFYETAFVVFANELVEVINYNIGRWHNKDSLIRTCKNTKSSPIVGEIVYIFLPSHFFCVFLHF